MIRQSEKLLLNPTDLNENSSTLKEIMDDYFNKSAEIVTQKFIFKLNWDLKVLTLFLEFYLIEEEKKLSIAPKEFFKKLNVHAVISYNYTDTFRAVYKKGTTRIPVHFVHGKLGNHNLVLGIGKTLPEDKKDNFTVCVSFKKCFNV